MKEYLQRFKNQFELLRTLTFNSFQSYSPEILCQQLATVDWDNEATDVQEAWDDFETKIIEVVDCVAPMSEFKNNSISVSTNRVILRKRNLRKRLLRQFKQSPTLELKTRLKQVNAEIKSHFHSEKRSKVRRNIIPGNSKSLWRAVKLMS